MNEWIEVTAKTVDDAIIEAGIKLGVSTENMEYEVIEKESSGFLGLNKKPAKIRAKAKEEEKPAVEDFLCKVFEAMGVKAEAEINFDEEEKVMNINLTGDDMGMLIGKRGRRVRKVRAGEQGLRFDAGRDCHFSRSNITPTKIREIDSFTALKYCTT